MYMSVCRICIIFKILVLISLFTAKHTSIICLFLHRKTFARPFNIMHERVNTRCPLKSHTYFKKPVAFSCSFFFKYVWPFCGHQALKGYIPIFNTRFTKTILLMFSGEAENLNSENKYLGADVTWISLNFRLHIIL